MGIDKVGIDEVGIDKVGIDKVGRYLGVQALSQTADITYYRFIRFA